MSSNKPELLVTQEIEPGIDLDLFLKIIPSVRIGDRVMRLDTIEETSYQEIMTSDGLDVESNQLAITHTSGNVYFFDGTEEVELEAALKEVLKKGEEQMTEIKMLRAENQALQQELSRVYAGQVKSKLFAPPGFGNKRT